MIGYRSYGTIRQASYLARVLLRLLSRGDSKSCNVCGFKGGFSSFGFPPRYDARCPACGSLERHRLLKFWVDGHADQLANKRLLHFAPEAAVTSYIKPMVSLYQTTDLNPAFADLVLNIESIDLPDSSFDVVLCSHVLEHVDDRKALAELYRILSPAGFAIIMVPLIEGWDKTYENPSILDAQARTKHFGQWDHVRYYGRDIRDRIRDAGFKLQEFTAVEPQVQEYGLLRGEKVFVASKTP